jgi:hypothetical protein
MNTIREKTPLEMFEDYEKILSAYMKANGTYKVKENKTVGEVSLSNDLRKQVQEYRKVLLEVLK